MSPVTGVTSRTRCFGIVGKPVRHTLSPAMQTAAFAAAGMDACYLAFEVSPDGLAAALAGAATLGFGGLNVTVPHKVAALSLAAERDPSAELTGAANTLAPAHGGWKAYNTDTHGFSAAVREEMRFDPRRGRAAIWGAGGAARAAIVGLAREGAHEILLTGRNIRRVSALAEELGPRLPGVTLLAVAAEELPERLAEGDLVASATPLGLDPAGRWPWELGRFAPGVLFYDMAYGPRGTPLERQAREAGFAAASGLKMLVLQGAEAFRIWTGRQAPTNAMERALSESTDIR